MESDPAQSKRVKDLCNRALDLDARARKAFLEQTCNGDLDLLREVESLLSHEKSMDIFLAQPAWGCVVTDIVQEHESIAGRQLGRYHIHERLGEGGMGEVWRATDQQLKRDVAIKILPPEFSPDAERVRRFEQEAFAVSKLNHPNIITIFEIIHDNGAHFIVSEYVEGETLRQRLIDPATNKRQRLSVTQAIGIAIQIASALKAAHTAWIIHRDIKPENIMVRDDGLVKVLDFGIAKLGRGDGKTRRVRFTGHPIASSARRPVIHNTWRSDGHGELYVAGASARRAARWADGSIFAGCGAV